MRKMCSNRPYLIRAYYDWLVDNECTPYILVDVDYPGVQVPLEYASANRIVLNISPSACRGLLLENDKILFTAKFSGQPMQVIVPPLAVLEIYAKENGRGTSFPPEEDLPPPPPSSGHDKKSKKKPFLRLVD